MNYFKINQIYFAAAIMLLIISCSKEGEYTLTETPPLDFTTQYNGLTVTFESTTEGATDISWDFGDQSTPQSGSTVEYTYASIGNYVITMTGTVNGSTYTMHTVLRVDKASVVDLEDDSFTDWDGVTYPDFILSGKGAILNSKVDYDANYLYVFVEFDATVENAGIDDHVFGIYLDSDNSVATGFSMKEMGVDYGCEGNLAGGWFDPSVVDLVNAEDLGWPFVVFSSDNALKPGTILEANGTIKMEFGVSREVFKINSDIVSFSLSVMDWDWSDVGNMVTPLPDYNEKITVMMNKQ